MREAALVARLGGWVLSIASSRSAVLVVPCRNHWQGRVMLRRTRSSVLVEMTLCKAQRQPLPVVPTTFTLRLNVAIIYWAIYRAFETLMVEVRQPPTFTQHGLEHSFVHNTAVAIARFAAAYAAVVNRCTAQTHHTSGCVVNITFSAAMPAVNMVFFPDRAGFTHRSAVTMLVYPRSIHFANDVFVGNIDELVCQAAWMLAAVVRGYIKSAMFITVDPEDLSDCDDPDGSVEASGGTSLFGSVGVVAAWAPSESAVGPCPRSGESVADGDGVGASCSDSSMSIASGSTRVCP